MAHKRIQKIRDLMNMETVHVCLDFLEENGLKGPSAQIKTQASGELTMITTMASGIP